MTTNSTNSKFLLCSSFRVCATHPSRIQGQESTLPFDTKRFPWIVPVPTRASSKLEICKYSYWNNKYDSCKAKTLKPAGHISYRCSIWHGGTPECNLQNLSSGLKYETDFYLSRAFVVLKPHIRCSDTQIDWWAPRRIYRTILTSPPCVVLDAYCVIFEWSKMGKHKQPKKNTRKYAYLHNPG